MWGLNGEYILVVLGGDLLWDGFGVLFIGRNIYVLDFYWMFFFVVYERGWEIV